MYKISWRRTNFICSFLHGFSRPYVMESKARSGFRILVVRGISDSLSCFPDPKAQDSRFHTKKIPDFEIRIPLYSVFSLTWSASMQIYWNKKRHCIHRICLGHQHGRRFIVLGLQYGRRDVMWKNCIRGDFSYKLPCLSKQILHRSIQSLTPQMKKLMP